MPRRGSLKLADAIPLYAEPASDARGSEGVRFSCYSHEKQFQKRCAVALTFSFLASSTTAAKPILDRLAYSVRDRPFTAARYWRTQFPLVSPEWPARPVATP